MGIELSFKFEHNRYHELELPSNTNNGPPVSIVPNFGICDLSRAKALDEISGRGIDAVNMLVDVLICGFSCKDASFLNCKFAGATHVIWEDGTTSFTFRAVKVALQRPD